jgi:hypothetical protein
MATICIIAAFKYYEETENLISNREWAKFLGVSTDHLLKMELSFASLLEFNFHVDQKAFDEYQAKLKKLSGTHKQPFSKVPLKDPSYSEASTEDHLSGEEEDGTQE